jgi:uncharacterized membrane protein YqjE
LLLYVAICSIISPSLYLKLNAALLQYNIDTILSKQKRRNDKQTVKLNKEKARKIRLLLMVNFSFVFDGYDKLLADAKG